LDAFDHAAGEGRERSEEDEAGWQEEGDSMRFYMAYDFFEERFDFEPVLRLVFRRLRAVGADWRYCYPSLRVVSFDRAQPSDSDPAAYDPSAALAAEEARREKEAELERMQAELDEGNREARERMLDQPPTPPVLAYEAVYGHEPDGWPPIP